MTIALKCLMKLKLNFFTEFIFKYVIPCRDSELRPDLTEGSTFKSSKKIQAAVKSGKFIIYSQVKVQSNKSHRTLEEVYVDLGPSAPQTLLMGRVVV